MPKTAVTDPHNSPTAWFAVLERARLIGDETLERRALAQLRRLGVSVRFDRREPQREVEQS